MISKLMLLEQVTIQEKKQLLLNKGIPNEIIDKLLQCDPTNKNKTDADKVGSYTDWIISRYLKDRSFTNFDKLKSQLQQYDRSKHKIPDKQMQNIGQFNTLNELITFVNNNQDKLAIASEEFVVKTETDHDMFYSRDFVIHVPHTEEQSIRLGSGTKWCTSQVNNNKFNSYYNKGCLLYITNKTKHQERYNLFLNLEYTSNASQIVEFADDKDKHFPYKLFNIVKRDNTLMPQIRNYCKYENIESEIPEQISEFLSCNTVYEVVQWYKYHIYPNADVYFETDEQKIINIISQSNSQYKYIPNLTHQVQLWQVSNNQWQIQYMENPDKEVQLQQVSQDGHQIEYIENPDKDVQLQQVSNDGRQIEHIENPDIDVQIQQVSQTGNQIVYIKNPDKNIQIQQVSQNGYQIEYIKNPDKDVQLQQVSQNGYQIIHIKIPDKEVQMQQVSNDGRQIEYIENPNIGIQMQQVSNNGYQIQHIKNPDIEVQMQQVSQDGQQIRFITNPNKYIQLQQIKQYPKQYFFIKNPDPEQRQLYNQLKDIKESATYINKLLDVN